MLNGGLNGLRDMPSLSSSRPEEVESYGEVNLFSCVLFREKFRILRTVHLGKWNPHRCMQL